MALTEPSVYPQALVGFRYWKTNEQGDLFGVSQERKWEAGRPTKSHCSRQHQGIIPSRECGCGMYAYNSLASAKYYRRTQSWRGASVMGVVVGRGSAQIHHDGWRAEEAAIVALAPIRPDDQQAAQRAADRYQVPLYSTPQELETVAQQYGTFISIPFNKEQPGLTDNQAAAAATIGIRRWQQYTKLAILGIAVLLLIRLLFGGIMIADTLQTSNDSPIAQKAIQLQLMNQPDNMIVGKWRIASQAQWNKQLQQFLPVMNIKKDKDGISTSPRTVLSQARQQFVDDRSSGLVHLRTAAEYLLILLALCIWRGVLWHKQRRVIQQQTTMFGTA